MMPANKDIQVDDNPDSYGSKGQSWATSFIEYMKFIVLHPTYCGMPDALKGDGKIQWETPSNRSGGQYKDSHHKRRDWWRAKAAEVGISDREGQWISRTAKVIHPTGEKPCKRCGQVLRIAYVYPNAHFISRAVNLFEDDMRPDELEEVGLYVRRLVDTRGSQTMQSFPKLFESKAISPPALGENLDAWLEWIEETYVPSEPALLSPGVMSNPPDRFDGFHSFNLCCRGKADTGRHKSNMQFYATDRRVFEYWSEGNWIAADRMMGLVRAKFAEHTCADGGEGPPSADHIGPLSLGFAHRPEFRLLSKSANSSKNNRMTFWDVTYLREQEARGIPIVSWYAAPIWNSLKTRVIDEETALRLSKVMRDNQRQAMSFLALLRDEGHVSFLASLLELEFADFSAEFDGLEIVNFVTSYRALRGSARATKYAAEQKSRRVRIGFEALRSYSVKANRHFKQLNSAAIDLNLELAHQNLSSAPERLLELDKEILGILDQPGAFILEEALREVCTRLPKLADEQVFIAARTHLQAAMQGVAAALTALWDDERYVRSESPFDEG